MARRSLLPFRELLVEAFKELDVPTPHTLLEDDEPRSDPRDVTRPDRKRSTLRDHTMTDVELPWALRTDSLPPELDLDDDEQSGEPTRPVDLRPVAAVLKATPPSLPIAIGAHTGVYRFTLNATDVLEPLEPADIVGVLGADRTPAPVPEVLLPMASVPTRGRRPSTTRSTSSSPKRSTRTTDEHSRPTATVSSEAPTPSVPMRRTERGPRPPTNRERAKVFYLAALDALSEQRVDDARALCSQAVTLAPKDVQYRALFQDLSTSTPPTKKKRPKRT